MFGETSSLFAKEYLKVLLSREIDMFDTLIEPILDNRHFDVAHRPQTTFTSSL